MIQQLHLISFSSEKKGFSNIQQAQHISLMDLKVYFVGSFDLKHQSIHVILKQQKHEITFFPLSNFVKCKIRYNAFSIFLKQKYLFCFRKLLLK